MQYPRAPSLHLRRTTTPSPPPPHSPSSLVSLPLSPPGAFNKTIHRFVHLIAAINTAPNCSSSRLYRLINPSTLFLLSAQDGPVSFTGTDGQPQHSPRAPLDHRDSAIIAPLLHPLGTRVAPPFLCLYPPPTFSPQRPDLPPVPQ